MSYTQDEFIAVCNAGLQSQLQVGTLIELNNTYCGTYEVIGTNHDGTTDTVDVMAHTQVGVQQIAAGNMIYNTCGLRNWINGTYFNAFDSVIKSLSKTMTVATYGGNTSDKVKILSGTEIGASNNVMPGSEGTRYPAFTLGSNITGFTDVWRSAGSYGHNSRIWLRSCYTTHANSYWWYVPTNGGLGYTNNYTNYGVLPVLRF